MTGYQLFTADQNAPFLIAMAITLIIAAIEVVSLLLGLGLSSYLDDLLPDFDTDIDTDIDGGIDADGVEGPGGNLFAEAFGWLNVGRVPLLVLLICCLALFALFGFALQMAAASLFGLLPWFVAAPLAFAATLPATRLASRGLARVVPREETYAVSGEQFVGLVATITLGPVSAARPGKARVNDRHGNPHYVRVRSAAKGERFEIGSAVLLVAREAAIYSVIAAPESLTTE